MEKRKPLDSKATEPTEHDHIFVAMIMGGKAILDENGDPEYIPFTMDRCCICGKPHERTDDEEIDPQEIEERILINRRVMT